MQFKNSGNNSFKELQSKYLFVFGLECHELISSNTYVILVLLGIGLVFGVAYYNRISRFLTQEIVFIKGRNAFLPDYNT
jgi:hypothetical protein